MNSQKECLKKNGWLRKREDKCEMQELDSKLKLDSLSVSPRFCKCPLEN